mgnify:CR=1 FL=1
MWSEYIAEMKRKWVGKKVDYLGTIYNIVDVDMNGGIMIDKPTKYTESHTNMTTALEAFKIKNQGKMLKYEV